jgi:RNA polymerase sigma-70 factor, ECF subfamily
MGDAIDVAAAWAEFGGRLRGYVSRRVPPGDADDIVQSVMLKLLERRGEVATGSVRAWLFTVTRNAVVEHYRQRRPAVDLDSFGDLPASEGGDAADRTLGTLSDCLGPMLRGLSDGDAEILRIVDMEGGSQVEIAASLGVPVSTLKSRVQRARTRLAKLFDACCDIERARNGAPIDIECDPCG